MNGTVLDTLSGLVWLADANCGALGNGISGTFWAAAKVAVAALASGTCGLTDGSVASDWRLATRTEWVERLTPANNLGCRNPSLVTDSGTACQGASSFAGVRLVVGYWTGSESGGSAYVADVAFGSIFTKPTCCSPSLVWPVRDGP